MYYKKSRGVFQKDSSEPYQVSRSKIELYLNCPRCFYMECRLGLARPSTPPYTLNSAVDNLLKNEFDLLRQNGQKHKLMEEYGIDAIPFKHDDLPQWRGEVTSFVGALYHHQATNLMINGLVDDIWLNSKGELIIVDYKSTSTTKEITLDDEYKQSYKRQMEIYQWIFRQLGFTVSKTGYFVFANAQKNLPKFDGKLEFAMTIVAHEGDDSWIENTLKDLKACLESDKIPQASAECEYCEYKKQSVQIATKWLSQFGK